MTVVGIKLEWDFNRIRKTIDAITSTSPLAMTANIPQMIINESMAALSPEQYEPKYCH
jgi:hypothetical protein